MSMELNSLWTEVSSVYGLDSRVGRTELEVEGRVVSASDMSPD